MIANFYIVNDTFAYPAHNPSLQEIETAIELFVEDYDYIRQYDDTNKVYYNANIFSEIIYPQILLEDIYNPSKTANWDKDVVRGLQIIWGKFQESNFHIDDVLEYLPLHNDKECHGLIGLHEIKSINAQPIEPFSLIYTKRNWLEFRRYFLGLYPKDTVFFIDECCKYFPELFFHEQNKESVKRILSTFSNKIVFHLSALNDSFKNINSKHSFLPDALQELSIPLDEKATLEGDAEKKKRLFFDFENNKNELEEVCCEPHLKLCKNDRNDQQYFFHRIYFHEGKSNIQNGKILVAHIGEHL